MTRGLVLPLTQAQRVARMRYLAKLAPFGSLDRFVRRPDGVDDFTMCPDIYYLLKTHNGGTDPTAPDPGTRWSKPGSTFVNITSDCIGGAAWCGGFDRFQRERFAHIYGGWINTNSMRMDAARDMRCFIRLAAPEPGCFVVFASGGGGHAIGHIGGVIEVPDGWNANDRASWDALQVVDVAARTPRPANKLTTGRTWWNTDAWFIRSIMMP
jgi:hypothetical protein